jgi:group II intron reverse transcriptase/maturase
VSTTIQRIAEQAICYPELVFTSIAHLIDLELLNQAYRDTRKDGSPGVSGSTAQEYEENLAVNLNNLYERMKNGNYQAPPVKRAWLEKEDGSLRPIGIPEFEDKIVQRAVTVVLSAIYEQDFYPFSYGFREKHSAHQALHELRENCLKMCISWIVDADITGFFDNLDHNRLREIIQLRVNDGSILRLIGKWLNAGVLEEETLFFPEKGTPQGGVISPLLANIYLHHVLDEWFVKQIQPNLKGKSFLVRFADDFVIGCELEEEAKWIMDVLKQRFAQFGLSMHPTKTALLYFGKPTHNPIWKSASLDFLGFTHYWAKSRRGFWVIKRKTAKKRIRRTCRRIWLWCRNNRHLPLSEQHKTLCLKLQGHFQYFAIPCNYRWLVKIYRFVETTWHYWLSRRSNKVLCWDTMAKILQRFSLPKPRIIHNI